MNRFQALVALNMSGSIGSIRLERLVKVFGSAEKVLKEKFPAFKKEVVDQELKLAKKLDLKIITLDDAEYPDNLKNIPDAPLVLYIKGEITKEDKISLGIVGSRRASFYGVSSAEKFAFELAQRGITIVSGMARGIDTASHRGALKAQGRTIAVIGSGFNHLYPPENKKLAEEISRNGAVVSEFPINIAPFKQNFPRRNRVISGLSLGILVVEAAQNSGALITADFALEQGRDVFALPGKVDAANSFGTNGLIKQGAKLVSSVEDILEEFALPITAVISQAENKISLNDEEESKLYSLISDKSIQFDDLIEKTNLDMSKLANILLKLQMRKLVKELPGKQFIKA